MTENALASFSSGRATGLDLSLPSSARMCDHLLNGKDNFECDRLAVAELLRAAPELARLVRAGRRFLTRTVSALAEHGIDQFLDLGAGLPASPCTHEMANAGRDVPCRVVYVDNDPIVAVHNRALLTGQEGVLVFQDDLRAPEMIIARLSAMNVVDFGRPVAVLFGDVLPYLPEPVQTVRAFRNVMTAGSALVLSHLAADRADPGMVAAVERIYSRTDTRLTVRTEAQIAELFSGFAHAPEVLDVRPDPRVPGLTCYTGVGWRMRGDQTRAAATASATTGQRENASAT